MQVTWHNPRFATFPSHLIPLILSPSLISPTSYSKLNRDTMTPNPKRHRITPFPNAWFDASIDQLIGPRTSWVRPCKILSSPAYTIYVILTQGMATKSPVLCGTGCLHLSSLPSLAGPAGGLKAWDTRMISGCDVLEVGLCVGCDIMMVHKRTRPLD
jgi:hypothetical protein